MVYGLLCVLGGRGDVGGSRSAVPMARSQNWAGTVRQALDQPAPDSPPSRSWSLYCDYAVTLTAKGRNVTFCFLYHTANLTDSRLEVILLVCTIHLGAWTSCSGVEHFALPHRKLSPVRESNWLMAMRDITNMYFDNYTKHLVVIHE